METVDPLWRPLTGASRKKKKKKTWSGLVEVLGHIRDQDTI